MPTSAEIAHTFTEVAVDNYRRDGHLVPTLILLKNEQRVYFVIAPSDDVPMTAAFCVMATAAAVRPDHVVLISEAWSRLESTEDRSAEEVLGDYKRGDLERAENAGDAGVMTVVVVHVLDCKNYDDSHMTLVTDHGDHVERTVDDSGLGEGRIPDLLAGAHSSGLMSEPPTFDIKEIAAILGTMGWISAMMLEGEQ